MTAFKALLSIGLALMAGTAEAQKTTSDQAGQAPEQVEPAPEQTGAAPEQVAQPPAAGPDGLVYASDPQSVVDAMFNLGYPATLGADSYGDPMISSMIAGANYTIYFYGCVEHANCQYLVFSAWWDLPEGWTLEAANAWNTEKIMGQVNVDANMDPNVDFFVSTEGGLTQANFADVLEWWGIVMDDLPDMIFAQ